jgi:hypothetical protein
MNLKKVVSPRLSARLGEHVLVISEARDRGLTWRQILQEVGPQVGLDPAAQRAELKLRQGFYRARAQVLKGKLAARCPAPATQPTAPIRASTSATARGLPPPPGVEHKNREPESDKDRLAKLGINFK